MNTKVLLGIAIVVLAVGGAAWFVMQQGGESPEEGSPQNTTMNNADTTEAAQKEQQANEELQQYVASFGEQRAQITYEGSVASGGGTNTHVFTMAWDAAGSKWRMDMSENGAEVGTFLYDGTSIYTCATEEQQCFKFEAQDSVSVPPGLSFMTPETFQEEVDSTLGGQALETSSRTIAGREARCFAGSDEQGGEGTVCFDTETGVVLAMEAEDSTGTVTSFAATDVSFDLADNAFTPPYKVMELPSSGNF